MAVRAFQVVKDFEAAVAAYCGAPYAVAVNSCTNALFLSLMWFKRCGQLPDVVEIPRFTYVSVPMQIMHAGANVSFRAQDDWSGDYQLAPLPLYDSARRFTAGMYRRGTFTCTSHHWTKILGIQQGGCILHDSAAADDYLRRARFDGRREGVPPDRDTFETVGWHCYLSPEVAAEGLVRLAHLPRFNADLPWSGYPDLSRLALFGAKPTPAVSEVRRWET